MRKKSINRVHENEAVFGIVYFYFSLWHIIVKRKEKNILTSYTCMGGIHPLHYPWHIQSFNLVSVEKQFEVFRDGLNRSYLSLTLLHFLPHVFLIKIHILFIGRLTNYTATNGILIRSHDKYTRNIYL